MNRRVSLAILVAALAIGTATVANAEPTSTLQADADGLLAHSAVGVLAEVDTPGHSVKVRSGVGDKATGAPVPWDAEFRIGSFTKTFVATTLLQLVGEHRLSLDDTVGHWLPGVVTGNGNDGDKITVRQVLQHTSGLPEYTLKLPRLFDQQAFERDRFNTVTLQQAVSLAMTMPPNFAPGTNWSYANTNYILAGLIIQRVTGHRWEDEVRDRILRPLGLRHTFLPGTSPFIPGPHARGYWRFTPDGPVVDVTALNPTEAGPAGEMISTTADGNRFLRALVRGELLRPAQLAEMEKTVPAPELGAAFPGARYGLGLLWLPTSCGGAWTHDGGIQGFNTINGVSPDGTRSVVASVTGGPITAKPGEPYPTLGIVDHALCD